MTNINCIKDSDRAKFVESILGAPHLTVFKDGKTVTLWYVDDADKKTIEELEKETATH